MMPATQHHYYVPNLSYSCNLADKYCNFTFQMDFRHTGGRAGERDDINRECVEASKGEGTYRYRGGGQEIKCKYIPDQKDKKLKHLQITLISPKGRVWAGVKDLQVEGDFKEGYNTATIKNAVRHGHSYLGGGQYGDFGGYDIVLFELDSPLSIIPTEDLACLPSPHYKDDDMNKGNLAGYGRYMRDQGRTCQTNEFGLGKHHYCESSGWGQPVCRQTCKRC